MLTHLYSVTMVQSCALLRFTVRSFFVGPVTQQHVNDIYQKMGDVKAPPKARYGLAISKPIYTYFALSALQVNASRKSVTLSWGKLGGLPAALGALSSQH